jgi:anti-sigma B factor antagonist
MATLQCDVEKSPDDGYGNKVTTVKCHGVLVSDTASEIKETVKPLLSLGGRIVVDLGHVSHLDSSGLGALVSLKVSAVRQGLCILEFVNMTPRILDLLRISNLTQLFSSESQRSNSAAN